STKYIYERNIYAFLALIALAGSFHYSAFMALPLWFLKPDHRYIKAYVMLIPIGFVLYFLGINVIANVPIPYVQTRIELYKIMQELGVGEKESFNVFSISYLAKVTIFLLLFFN